jgi:hypothetical protein
MKQLHRRRMKEERERERERKKERKKFIRYLHREIKQN